MWSAIRAFFARLFGSPTPSQPETSQEPARPTQPSATPGATHALILQRTASSAQGITGEMTWQGEQVGITLEGPNDGSSREHPLAAGTYELALSTLGGLHATYAFRFGEAHHGVLKIQTLAPKTAYIQIGHDAALAYGSIFVGSELVRMEHKLQLAGSEETYSSLYAQLIPTLVSGQNVELVIQDPV